MPAFRGYVVVSGPPASGKSSLAPALATALDLPLLAKDVVKDALVDVLGAPDLPRSRELGRAAVHVLLAVARTAGRGVLEGVWFDYARAPLAGAAGPAWSRCSAGARRPCCGRATRRAARPAERAGSTSTATPTSCGTPRSVPPSPATGRCWRSTPRARWTSPALAARIVRRA